MSIPYENATSGDKALGEVQKMLRAFGCTKFGSFIDDDEQVLTVQFVHRDKTVSVPASMKGYAQAWLKKHPYSNRMKKTRQQHEQAALEIANIAVYSIIRDWVKANITLVEVGILSFEGAFLAQIMLPSGHTVLEYAKKQELLPWPGGE